MTFKLSSLLRWLSDSLSHAVGNPREEKAHQPPPVGTQPYPNRPHKA